MTKISKKSPAGLEMFKKHNIFLAFLKSLHFLYMRFSRLPNLCPRKKAALFIQRLNWRVGYNCCFTSLRPAQFSTQSASLFYRCVAFSSARHGAKRTCSWVSGINALPLTRCSYKFYFFFVPPTICMKMLSKGNSRSLTESNLTAHSLWQRVIWLTNHIVESNQWGLKRCCWLAAFRFDLQAAVLSFSLWGCLFLPCVVNLLTFVAVANI